MPTKRTPRTPTRAPGGRSLLPEAAMAALRTPSSGRLNVTFSEAEMNGLRWLQGIVEEETGAEPGLTDVVRAGVNYLIRETERRVRAAESAADRHPEESADATAAEAEPAPAPVIPAEPASAAPRRARPRRARTVTAPLDILPAPEAGS
jgi:hypothetical protein